MRRLFAPARPERGDRRRVITAMVLRDGLRLALLCLVAAAACVIQARRAATVDPMTAMRIE